MQITTVQENDNPALPGQPLNLKAFRNWIRKAEDVPAIDLKTAKTEWKKKKKQLLKLTK